MLSKKGESASYMGGKTTDIILALIALSVIGLVLFGFFGNSDFFSELTCKVTVYMADQTEKAPIIKYTPFTFPIICSTKDKVIEEDNEDKVMWEIADYMRKCWSMWGEGNLNPAGKNVWFNDEFKCFKCYRLSFNDFEGIIDANEWDEFFKDPEKRVKGSDLDFYNYFKGNILLGTDDEGNFVIEKDKYYGVTFVEHIEKDRWGRYVATATTGATVVGGACMFVVGVGWIASPLCVLGGGALGAGAAAIEQFIDKISSLIVGEDKDIIMLSRYEDVKKCGGYIE